MYIHIYEFAHTVKFSIKGKRKSERGVCLEIEVKIGIMSGWREILLEKNLEVFNGAVRGELDNGGFAANCTDYDFLNA